MFENLDYRNLLKALFVRGGDARQGESQLVTRGERGKAECKSTIFLGTVLYTYQSVGFDLFKK